MMKIKSVAALAAAFMLLGSSALYVPAFAAQGSGFNVKADEIEYDMTSGNGTAKGNVVILHDGGKATAAAAEFNSKTMSGKLTGGVVADKDDAHITCATFVMHNEDFVSAVGEASVTKEDKTLTAEQIDYHSELKPSAPGAS